MKENSFIPDPVQIIDLKSQPKKLLHPTLLSHGIIITSPYKQNLGKITAAFPDKQEHCYTHSINCHLRMVDDTMMNLTCHTAFINLMMTE